MKTRYLYMLLLCLLVAGACSDGELEGDLYPVAPDNNEGGGDIAEESRPDVKLDGMDFVFVNAGMFMMGATKEQAEYGYGDELPVQNVSLTKNFYIGKFEVTQEQWESVMADNPSYHDEGGNYPVENVSWNMAQQFIKKRNTSSRITYRLPTEAEWEYAARGGRKSKKNVFSGNNILYSVGWYEGNSSDDTHRVGTKNANELGIYDMSGNVYEWCNDWYGVYKSGNVTDPAGNSSSSGLKVLRGGCYDDEEEDCRVASRHNLSADEKTYYCGFRLVAAYEPSQAYLLVTSEQSDSIALITSKGYASYLDLCVKSSATWSVSSSVSWITYTIQKDTLRVNIAKNPSKSTARTGYLTVKSGDLTQKITVEQEKLMDDYLKVSTGEVDSVSVLAIPGMASTMELKVECSDVWNIENSASWITPTLNKNKNLISLKFEDNYSSYERSAVLTVWAGSLQQKITVTQRAYSVLDVSKSQVVFQATAGTEKIKLYYEEMYSCTYVSNQSWCTASRTGSELTLKVTANPTVSSRTANVTVTVSGMSKNITVTQEGKPKAGLQVSPLSISPIKGGGTYYSTVTVTNSTSSWACQSDSDWCKAVVEGERVKMTVGANTGIPRTARVTVTVEEVSEEILVTQAGTEINLGVNISSLQFEAAADTKSVTVTSSISTWEYSSSDYWCSLTKSGNQLNIAVSPNNTGSTRRATVTITAGGKQVTVSVTQATVSLSVSSSSLQFESAEATKSVVISTSASTWEYSSSSSWCSFTKSGNQLNITVEKNNTTSSRSAIVTITAAGRQVTVSVTQAKKTISLLPSSLSFTAGSKREDVMVTSTAGSWTARLVSSTDWCNIQSSGNTLTVMVGANATKGTRTVTVEISSGSSTEQIIVTQSGIWAIGDYYEVDDIKGVVYQVFTNGTSGMLLSLKGSQKIWGSSNVSTGATSSTDGEDNMRQIKKITDWKTKYPAFEWCDLQNTGNVTGWYFPAINELRVLSDACRKSSVINTSLTSNGGTSFSGTYWSSTETSNNNSFYYNNSSSNSQSKATAYLVRAVRSF